MCWPSATVVLEKRRGLCQSHSLLFIALARASGIPAREVGGNVWGGPGSGGLFGHAWAQVALDGRWQSVDPALGQPIADATHIDIWPCPVEMEVLAVERER